ncbi:MAG: CRTAC1 family protein [Cyclobacteriaceae bacterium]|nr:CRTAC1 family protein [Cyclobacteriaceae bacterium]
MEKNTFLPVSIIIFLVFALSVSCKKKEAPQESQSFTEESHDFTSDAKTSRIEHIRFTDITSDAGIDFQHITGAFGQKWMPETIGSGGGFLDFDNDGLVDIFLVNSAEWAGHEVSTKKPGAALYKNKGNGRFEDVSAKSGITFSIYGMGASFADFDADGDQDIYMTAVGDNMLLRNDDGVFTDITAQMKVKGNDPKAGSLPAWSSGSAWVDIDRDGWLDLFVNNYVRWTPDRDIYTTRDGQTKSYATPDVYEGESNRLYRNIQGRTFEDITEVAGVYNAEGKSLGIAVADFNNDLWPDIVISNDTQPNFLYINNGDGTFASTAVASGIAFDESGRARAGMGIDVADVVNDGNMAIVIGNFSQEPLSLYTQMDNTGLFQDRAGAARLTKPSLLQLTFGVLFVDLDLDGFLELITANGHIEPEINAVQKNITFAQKPQVFYNDHGKFIDIGEAAGAAFGADIVGRGVAAADIDMDGDLDVLITTNGGKPLLLRNDSGAGNKSVTLVLKGLKPNNQAIGAKVTAWVGGIRQQRMVRTGSSFLTQSDIGRMVFGVGANSQIDSLHIIWPTSGKTQKIEQIPTGQLMVIEEK